MCIYVYVYVGMCTYVYMCVYVYMKSCDTTKQPLWMTLYMLSHPWVEHSSGELLINTYA